MQYFDFQIDLRHEQLIREDIFKKMVSSLILNKKIENNSNYSNMRG
jgi:hypothetical protein